MQDPLFSNIPIFESPLQFVAQDYQNDVIITQPQPDYTNTMIHKNTTQKLLQNKLRRQQILKQRKQQKQNILFRRKQKQTIVAQNIKKKQKESHLKMEKNLRGSNSQQFQRQKIQQERQNILKQQFRIKQEKLEACRKKAEQIRMNYVYRVHNKNKQKQFMAFMKRGEQNEWKDCQDFHLQQWNNHKNKIQKKHSGNIHTFNRLYNDFKQKILVHRSIKTSNHPRKKMTENQIYGKINSACRERQFVKTQSIQMHNQSKKQNLQNETRRHKPKAEYFGVHSGDMFKETEKDLIKMRNFLFQKIGAQNIDQQFQKYLFNQIL